MDIGLIYFCVGISTWAVLVVLMLIACGRYAFMQALHEYPKLEKCPVIPGVLLVGEDEAPWVLLFLANVVVFGCLGLFAVTALWPLAFGFLIQSIIKSSRTKRGFRT